MDQDADRANIDIENAFNRARYLAIGEGARVNSADPNHRNRPDAAEGRSPRTGNITITNSFNDASAIAVGNAQMNTGPTQACSTHTRASTRPGNVFISYSRQDQPWLAALQTQLTPLESQKVLECWYDMKIQTGIPWEQAILSMLRAADVAILLVSAHFLASDFIIRYELPCILQRHTQGQLYLLPLVVAPCLYRESPLGTYQAFNPPNKPLSTLSAAQVAETFVRVARSIQQALHLVHPGG
ncbi:MAG TPA: toll/interleukin-1 receptor domain-containing protein [Ktedonobacteraceae bacterium]